MSKKTLTPKQYTFCRKVAQGNSLVDAYRMAYNTDNMNDASCRKEASQLMCKNPLIAPTVLEERDRIATAEAALALSDVDRIKTKLRSLLDNAQGLPKEQVMLRAADLLAKINNLYVIKTEDVSPDRSLEEVQAELESRLAALEGNPADTRH